MNIGQRINARRKELDMSADELAEKLGKSRSTVFRYENGDVKNLPLDILEPVAKALNTTPAYLMGWDEHCNCSIKSNDPPEQEFYDKLKKLELTDTELKEVYSYAEFIKNKR